jgi:hypothetical protein
MVPIFEAILESEREVARLLRPTNPAAAGLRTGAAAILLESGSDPKGLNRRGASPLVYPCNSRPKGNTWGPPKQIEMIKLLVQRGPRSTYATVAMPRRFTGGFGQEVWRLCASCRHWGLELTMD